MLTILPSSSSNVGHGYGGGGGDVGGGDGASYSFLKVKVEPPVVSSPQKDIAEVWFNLLSFFIFVTAASYVCIQWCNGKYLLPEG